MIQLKNRIIKLIICMSFAAAPLAAFDWPQQQTASDSFYSYFAQLRGGTISSSLVFGESADVKTADKGRILIILDEECGDNGMFQSTLGNAVIVAHEDSIDSVYANLAADSMPGTLSKLTSVEAGTPLGTCANSGWQEGKSCLEFQVIDTKNKTAVNPRILMPRIGKELDLTIKNVTAVNRKGTEFMLGIQRSFQAGTYLLYRERQSVAMPYRTIVNVNGAAVETITYDTLVQNSSRLCVSGKTPYSVELMYPDSKRQLLAEVTFPRGRDTISVTVIDILGKEKTMTYTADAY
jgi:hypothetical protein